LNSITGSKKTRTEKRDVIIKGSGEELHRS
jgi:hypothetical protein